MSEKVKLIIEISKKDYEWAKQIAQTKNESVYCERQILAISNGISALSENKGEWIQDKQYEDVFTCSKCNEPFFLYEGTPKDNYYNFCPNCGADLRGE